MARLSTSTRGSATGTAIAFAVLGPLEVRDGTDVVDLPGRQERAVLALLLTAPGRVFSVSEIVAGIWGETPPARAEKTVQSYVSRLRRALPGDGASIVHTRSPGYRAAVDPMQVDTERFRIHAANGRRQLAAGDHQDAASELREALVLWRGEAYAEFDAPFAAAARTELEELRLAALEDRVAVDMATGAGPELVGELEALVDRHPWRERLWAQLMTALYRSGRQGDALGAFRRARGALVDDLGVEPGPELRAVEALVLAQDVELLRGDRPSVPLPPALTVVGPTLVGREVERARLLQAYDRAAGGSVERLLVTGAHGIGKTRLLADLAREAQERGALVCDGTGAAWPQQNGAPVVVLVDDLQRMTTGQLAALAERVVAARPPLLLVGASVEDRQHADQTAAISKIFRDRVELPPLRAPEVAELVALYVPAARVEDGVVAVADAAGVPLQVHAGASRYAEELAATQVEEAAAGIVEPRRHLSASQNRVAEGVLDLHRIRVVRAAHEPAETPTPMCPYKGLAFFDVDDAPYFFGRERLVARLVARLVDARVLTIVGASGSGKSSVVRAGLIAAVRAGMLPGSERWRILLTAPTRPPPDVAASDTRTVLVVDQFEELFTALSPSQQERYAGWLTEAAAADEVSVVVAVRSDYYAMATVHRAVSDLVATDTVLVGEMTADELTQAIELPAAAAGLELEPGLAQAIVGDVAGEPGGLPLLSTALLALWERRVGRRLSVAAYHELGGVRIAVTRLAETAYRQLTDDQQVAARRVLLRLADTGETGEPVRRRVPLAEVVPGGDADARAVVDTLAARRLLTVSETHAEVAHEALLREWPRLRGWLDEDEAGRRLRRHLAPAARDWHATGRDATELYRGPRLAAGLDWQRDHPDDLTEVEHAFLHASRAAAEAETVRRRRSIRRLRGLVVGLVGVLVLAVVAALAAVDQRDDAARSSLAADVRALQAKALDEDRWDRALLYAAQAHRFEASADSQAALLQTVQRSPEATAILGADQPLHTAATSGDGGMVAAGGANGTVFVWDTQTRRLRHTIPDVTAFWATSLDISPDGRYIAAVGLPVAFVDQVREWTFHVMIVDLEQTPPSVRRLERAPSSSARFTADSRTVVVLGNNGRVRYVDAQTGAVQRRLDVDDAETGGVPNPVLDGPENRRFIVASDPGGAGTVAAWEVDSGRLVWSSEESDGTVAAISPDGSALVLGHADGRIDRVDLAGQGTRTRVPSTLVEGLVDVAWSPDGSTFAGATQERTVLVWDADTLQADALLRGHWAAVTQAVYSPDGKVVYAPGSDRSVLMWNLTGETGIIAGVGAAPDSDAMSTQLARDGSVAAAWYPDGRVEVFDVASGATFEVVVPGDAAWMTVDPLGRYVLGFVGTESGRGPAWQHVSVNVIDVDDQRLLPHTAELELRTAAEAVVTTDGRALLTAAERQLGLMDLATGEPLSADLYRPTAAVSALAVHPDGRLAALSTVGNPIGMEVIDLTTGELVAAPDMRDVSGERLPLGPVTFSPDGRLLAAASWSGRILAWDTRTWQVYRSWEAVPGSGEDSLAFTPDSRFLVSGGGGAASIWNVRQGARGHATLDVDPLRPESAVAVGVRDDGRTIVTFAAGTGVRAWNVEPQRLREHACAVAGRNLTRDEWSDVLPDRPYERSCRQYRAN